MKKDVDYLVIGHVTRDLVGESDFRIGGTATFAALTAKNLGYNVGVVTSTDDPKLLEPLESQGVYVHNVPSVAATTFRNIYNGRFRVQIISEVASPIKTKDIPKEWSQKASIVHLGPVTHEVESDMINIFTGQTLLGVTPQGWFRKWDKDGIVHFQSWTDAEKILSKASAVVFSPEDVAGNSPGGEKNILEIAQNSSITVVTLAEHGALLYQGSSEAEYFPARLTQVADPTGAGDVFAAAFFICLHETDDPRQSCRFANLTASLNIEESGLRGIPTRDQVEKILAQI